MGIRFVLRRLALGSTRGGVLVEVVFGIFLLMVVVVGIASVSVRVALVGNQGLLGRELADHARLLLEEEGLWTADGLVRMGELLRDRMRLPDEDVGAVVYHVRRNGVTGFYEVLDTKVLGGLSLVPALSVSNVPDPNPGLVAQGIVVGLELGEEVVVVQTAVVFRGILRGLGSRSTRSTWALVPVD